MPLGYAYALAEVAHNYNMEHPDHRLAINVVANEYEDTHITRRGRIGDRSHSTPVVVDKGHVHISSEMPLSVKQKARDLWEQRKQELEDEDNNIKLNISDQDFTLDSLDINNIEEPKLELLPDLLIDEIEILE